MTLSGCSVRAVDSTTSPSLTHLPVQRRATRTYTGEALARRKAWGKLWGQRIKLATQAWKREIA